MAMVESKKNRPTTIAQNAKWLVCRDCGTGMEVADGAPSIADPPKPTPDGAPTTSVAGVIMYEELTYVSVQKTPQGLMRYRFSDPARTVKISEEKIG